MVGNFESFDHQPVKSTDAESVQDSECTISALLSCNEDFPARHALGIRPCLLNDEETSQCDGKHGSEESSQGRNDERLHPLDAGPDAHDQQSGNGKNHTGCEGLSRRCHGLHGVVFKDGDIFEHRTQDDHGHDRGRDAGGDRHAGIEPQVSVGGRHEHTENNADDDDPSRQLKWRFMSGNVRFLCAAHGLSNPFQ